MSKNQVPPWCDSLTKREAKKMLPYAQVAMYVLAGGGLVGLSYAEGPANAYCDARLSKRPYPVRAIEMARLVLVAIAERAGFNPASLPKMPNFGNLGIF